MYSYSDYQYGTTSDKNNKKSKIMTIILILIGLVIIGAIVFFLLTVRNNETFVVTFMDTDGVYAIEAGVKRNSTVNEPKVDPREGYEFLGWYLNENKYDFSTPVTADLYLKMKWFKEDTYEIEEISEEKEQEVIKEQEANKEAGNVKTQTKDEVQQNKPTSSPKPSNSPQPSNSPTPTTNPTPNNDPVKASINLSTKSIMCTKGSMATITVAVSNGTLSSYKSNNTNIATVADSNVQPKCVGCKSVDVTCKNTGSTSITFVANDGTKENASVTVKEASTIAFTSKSITCTKGETTTTVINSDSSGINSFTSSNTGVATVNQSANQPSCTNCKQIDIVCNEVGTTTLTAISNSGANDTATVTVKEKPTEITFTPTSLTCNVGDTKSISVVSAPSNIKTFVSTKASIITVSKGSPIDGCKNCTNINVTCVKDGTAYVKVTTEDGTTKQLKVTVNKANSYAATPYCQFGELKYDSNGNPYCYVQNCKEVQYDCSYDDPCASTTNTCVGGYTGCSSGTKKNGRCEKPFEYVTESGQACGSCPGGSGHCYQVNVSREQCSYYGGSWDTTSNKCFRTCVDQGCTGNWTVGGGFCYRPYDSGYNSCLSGSANQCVPGRVSKTCTRYDSCNTTAETHLKYKCDNGGTLDTSTKTCKY